MVYGTGVLPKGLRKLVTWHFGANHGIESSIKFYLFPFLLLLWPFMKASSKLNRVTYPGHEYSGHGYLGIDRFIYSLFFYYYHPSWEPLLTSFRPRYSFEHCYSYLYRNWYVCNCICIYINIYIIMHIICCLHVYMDTVISKNIYTYK
jgi:hypothetical protein